MTTEPPSPVAAEPALIPAVKGRTLCLVDRVETMLAALARMRGVDADAAISVAIVEDYLRCRAALGRDLE